MPASSVALCTFLFFICAHGITIDFNGDVNPFYVVLKGSSVVFLYSVNTTLVSINNPSSCSLATTGFFLNTSTSTSPTSTTVASSSLSYTSDMTVATWPLCTKKTTIYLADAFLDLSTSFLPQFPTVATVTVPAVVLFASPQNAVFGSLEVLQFSPPRPSLDPSPAPSYLAPYSVGKVFFSLPQQNGHSFLLVSSVNNGVSGLVVVSDVNVDVQVNPLVLLTTTNPTVSLSLGQRIVWNIPSSSSSRPVYLRMSDASGNVFPFSDVRYTLAFNPAQNNPQNAAELFANFSAPLQQRLLTWTTPRFLASGVFFFRDMLAPFGTPLVRVVVSDSQGNAPNNNNNGNVLPVFQDNLVQSPQGIDCACGFGQAPNIGCRA